MRTAAPVIILLVIGYFLVTVLRSPESYDRSYFLQVVDDYPWVRYAQKHRSQKELSYREEIVFLYSADKRIGFALLNIEWLKDYITDDEARALSILASVAGKDPETALSISQTVWFQRNISPLELDILEQTLLLAERDVQLAKNITSASWYFIATESRIQEMVRTVGDMPVDLALSVSAAPWFTSDPTLSESGTVQELITLYSMDRNLALSLSEIYQPRDFRILQYITELYLEDRELSEEFFQFNTLSRESYLALSDLSRLYEFDKELARSLTGELTQDKIQIIASLADIYSHDPDLGEFASATFGSNRIALRYIQKVLEVEHVEPPLLERVALFITTNSEFVYEDRIEPYRYHLLTQIIAEFPLETAQSYKNLISVTCSVYGSRFYLWQNSEYGKLEGWSSDRKLLDLERDAIMKLLHFLIEKNEKGVLATDLRMEPLEYLYGVLDIPFTYLVNLDGTTVETTHPLEEGSSDYEREAEPTHDERGTSFVFAIIYNINTLDERSELVQEKLYQIDEMKYEYHNRVTDLILKEGEKRDVLFLYFSAKNWELGKCVDEAMHTRMDCIVMGISTTIMHWTAPESAHVYPAYIPSNKIAEKIKSDPRSYGNPFVYRNFIAPYDRAGFRSSLDWDIEIVEIYDPQTDERVNLFSKSEEKLIYDEKTLIIVLVGLAVIVFIVADTLKIMK